MTRRSPALRPDAPDISDISGLRPHIDSVVGCPNQKVNNERRPR